MKKMKKKLKKYGQTGLAMAGTGIGLSVASQVAGGAGATHAQGAIGKMSSAMPAIGGIMSAGMTMDIVKEGLSMPKKKKGKKY